MCDLTNLSPTTCLNACCVRRPAPKIPPTTPAKQAADDAAWPESMTVTRYAIDDRDESGTIHRNDDDKWVAVVPKLQFGGRHAARSGPFPIPTVGTGIAEDVVFDTADEAAHAFVKTVAALEAYQHQVKAACDLLTAALLDAGVWREEPPVLVSGVAHLNVPAGSFTDMAVSVLAGGALNRD